MLFDMPHQPLQIRREFLVHFLSLFVGKLVGIRANPLQQRHRLRAGPLDATAPCRAPLLRLFSRHYLFPLSSTSTPRSSASLTPADLLMIPSVANARSLDSFATSLSSRFARSGGTRTDTGTPRRD